MKGPFEIICEDTSLLPRSEWLELRKKGIGSSEAAAVLGLSPWASPYSVWADKRGLLPEVEDNDLFWWGRALEPLIIERWCEQYERPEPRRHLMLRSAEHSYMLDNPDGVIPGAAVEAKTAAAWKEAEWDGVLPDTYAIQGAHHCIVLGVTRCYFPVLFGGSRLKEFVIDYDQATFDAIIAAEGELWRRVVENDPPDPDGSEATMLAIRVQLESFERGMEVELPPEAEEWIEARTQYEALAKAHQEVADEAKQRLMLALGAAEVGTLDGAVAVTFRGDKNGKRSMRFPVRKVLT